MISCTKYQLGILGARETAGVVLEGHTHCFGIWIDRSGKMLPPCLVMQWKTWRSGWEGGYQYEDNVWIHWSRVGVTGHAIFSTLNVWEFSVIKTKTLFWWIYRDTHFLLKKLQFPVVSRLNSISLTPLRGEASLLKSKQIWKQFEKTTLKGLERPCSNHLGRRQQQGSFCENITIPSRFA